jgi:hypothetical protein
VRGLRLAHSLRKLWAVARIAAAMQPSNITSSSRNVTLRQGRRREGSRVRMIPVQAQAPRHCQGSATDQPPRLAIVGFMKPSFGREGVACS